MSVLTDDLRRRTTAWLEDDPDPETRAELSKLIAAGEASAAQIADCFSGHLVFGTAGLRGLIGPGPNRMNRVVVARATRGLCEYLLATTPDAAERGICIGYDGRRMSREFARDVAEIVAGAGIRAFTFDHVVPTPLLAFSVLDRRAAAGVMVTASHNPPAYNGYKVYWGNGAQIIPPHDEGIAAKIAAVGPTAKIPRREGAAALLGDDVERRYLDGVRELALHAAAGRDLRIAYTALHGVGERLLRAALGEAGFAHVFTVREQAEPDARFPTVEFPNPEEKGAMDLVLELARRENADIVVANDPDADRLAVAVPSRPDGRWVQLTGNDVGALLAHYYLDQGPQDRARFVLSSIVSSPMLGAIARAHAARWEPTLTGFKWIANRALEIERETGARFVMGFEEALGYTVGTLVRDKDGIGAAAAICDLAAWCKSRGQNLLDELEEAWRRYGLYLSRTISVTMPGLDGAAKIAGIMSAVRRAPPARLGAHEVIAVQDLEARTRTARGGAPEAIALPSSNVIALELAGDHRVMLRPSGTEPKIKYYFDVCVTMQRNEPLAAARARGEAVLEELVGALRAITDTVV